MDNIGFKSSLFQPVWPWNLMDDLEKLYITSSFVHHLKPLGEFKLELLSGNAQFGSKSPIFFVPCDLEMWWMTLKNNRAPLPCNIKLCASFQSHRWFQTGVTVRKRSMPVKIGDFLSCVTLKFDGWPWKTIGYLFYVASDCVHHFITIGKSKLKLVWKRSIRVKISNFLSRVTLKFDGWPWKTIGHLFYATPSFVHHFVAIGEFKLELQSGKAQFGPISTIFLSMWPWNFTDILEN